MPLVIGPPHQAKPGDTAIQSMLFKKDIWTEEAAEKYLKDNNFRGLKRTELTVEEEKNSTSHIYEQTGCESFVSGTIRTITVSIEDIIKASVGQVRTF